MAHEHTHLPSLACDSTPVTIFGTCSLLQVPKFNLMNVEAPLASREDLLPLFYMVHDVLATAYVAILAKRVFTPIHAWKKKGIVVFMPPSPTVIKWKCDPPFPAYSEDQQQVVGGRVYWIDKTATALQRVTAYGVGLLCNAGSKQIEKGSNKLDIDPEPQGKPGRLLVLVLPPYYVDRCTNAAAFIQFGKYMWLDSKVIVADYLPFVQLSPSGNLPPEDGNIVRAVCVVHAERWLAKMKHLFEK